MRTHVFTLFLLCLSAWPAWCQEEETGRPATIIVDRPSFGNGSKVVGRDVISLESGLLVTTAKGSGQTLTQTPMLLRVGTSEDWEFRLGTNLLNYQERVLGVGDLAPGFKWNFLRDPGASVSLVGSLQVPSGSAAFQSPGVVPSLSLAADFPLDDSTGLLVNLGALSPGQGQERVIQAFGTVGVSTALSQKSSLYFELAGFSPAAPGQPATTAGDVVVTYLVNPDLQLDAAVFKGFSSSGLDWGFTFGVSTRF
ncbi:MAG: transporter [Candidatus Eremiobacteraeota bacterium]|nr:transporter [Candidatus Eremiobacteraeota bacterium]